VASWAGSGAPGRADGPLASATFDEPSGLAVARGRIYVADTSNHAIRAIDLAAGQVSTLDFHGL